MFTLLIVGILFVLAVAWFTVPTRDHNDDPDQPWGL